MTSHGHTTSCLLRQIPCQTGSTTFHRSYDNQAIVSQIVKDVFKHTNSESLQTDTEQNVFSNPQMCHKVFIAQTYVTPQNAHQPLSMPFCLLGLYLQACHSYTSVALPPPSLCTAYQWSQSVIPALKLRHTKITHMTKHRHAPCFSLLNSDLVI